MYKFRVHKCFLGLGVFGVIVENHVAFYECLNPLRNNNDELLIRPTCQLSWIRA